MAIRKEFKLEILSEDKRFQLIPAKSLFTYKSRVHGPQSTIAFCFFLSNTSFLQNLNPKQ